MKNTFKYYAGMLLIGVTLANISCSSDEDGITNHKLDSIKYFRAHCTSLGYS